MNDAPREVASRMLDAAVAFLGSVDPDERQLAEWPSPSDNERHRWFYTPTDHGGVTMAALRLPPNQALERTGRRPANQGQGLRAARRSTPGR
jgi:hypothetical protein